MVLEVGNRQTGSNILDIRDRMLCWRTSVNVFVTISYDRNTVRALDSWYVQIAIRDYHAPQPPPGSANDYPQCIIVYETPKDGPRYPKLADPLPPAARSYTLETRHLYHPEVPPAPPFVNPPIPHSFIFNVEQVRQTILRSRPP